MRYRELPKVKFKKGTSKNKRRVSQRLLDRMSRRYSADIVAAAMENILYGESFLKVTYTRR